MIIIHSTESHIHTLPEDLRDSMISENIAISSNCSGLMEIYFTDARWPSEAAIWRAVRPS